MLMVSTWKGSLPRLTRRNYWPCCARCEQTLVSPKTRSLTVWEASILRLEVRNGERRLDVLELRQVCQALGVTLPDFIARLERQLAANG